MPQIRVRARVLHSRSVSLLKSNQMALPRSCRAKLRVYHFIANSRISLLTWRKEGTRSGPVLSNSCRSSPNNMSGSRLQIVTVRASGIARVRISCRISMGNRGNGWNSVSSTGERCGWLAAVLLVSSAFPPLSEGGAYFTLAHGRYHDRSSV